MGASILEENSLMTSSGQQEEVMRINRAIAIMRILSVSPAGGRVELTFIMSVYLDIGPVMWILLSPNT